jgi:hypothetical protein
MSPQISSKFSLLIVAIGISLAGCERALIATETLNIAGKLPTQLNKNQRLISGLAFVIARNELANTPDGLSDPWPCAEKSEIVVFLPNTVEAYQEFKKGVIKQNYKLEKEIFDRSSGHYSFLFNQDKVTLLGLWAKAPVGSRSTLVICVRSVNWKDVPLVR